MSEENKAMSAEHEEMMRAERLLDRRLKLAWDHFSLSARQRVTMFNFFPLSVVMI